LGFPRPPDRLVSGFHYICKKNFGKRKVFPGKRGRGAWGSGRKKGGGKKGTEGGAGRRIPEKKKKGGPGTRWAPHVWWKKSGGSEGAGFFKIPWKGGLQGGGGGKKPLVGEKNKGTAGGTGFLCARFTFWLGFLPFGNQTGAFWENFRAGNITSYRGNGVWGLRRARPPPKGGSGWGGRNRSSGGACRRFFRGLGGKGGCGIDVV